MFRRSLMGRIVERLNCPDVYVILSLLGSRSPVPLAKAKIHVAALFRSQILS